jgi:hypothetical protein
MMKKILVFISIMFVAPLLTMAQFSKYRQFGVKTGLNISNVNAGSSSFTATDVLGTTIGFTYDRVHLRFLTVGTELNFIQKGFGKEVTLLDSLSQPLGTFNNQNKISYVSIPLKLGIQLGNRFYIFGNAAIIPGLVYKAVSEVPVFDANGKVISTYFEDIKGKTSVLDLSSQIELGFGITRGRFKFYLSGAKMDSFINLWSTPIQDFNIKSTGLIAAAGIKVEFGKGLLK